METLKSKQDLSRKQDLDRQRSKKKVAVCYPAFLGGGAEAVGLWMLQALQDQYDLTLFTVADVNFDRLNAMYGTQLSSQTVRVQSLVPAAWRSLCYLSIANSMNLRMLWFHGLIRQLKAHQHDHDLLASAYNGMDLGCKGIQYLHWVNVLEATPFRHLSRFSTAQMKENISLTNSQFVADRIHEVYGIDATVIFPPVVMQPSDLPWQQRQESFVCSGRIAPAKEPHKVIQILKQVRDRGFDIRLALTGGGGGTYPWGYERQIHRLVQENADWVTLHKNLTYADYIKVMSRCKYGIHYKREPFGISIAEMVKAGLIPFVKREGGQREIVGEQNQDLFFDNEAEAVERIVQVLSDGNRQQKLLASLQHQQDLFSTDRFVHEIRQVFDRFFATEGDGDC